MAPEKDNNKTPPSWWVDLPETEYQKAIDLQLSIVNAKTTGHLHADVILCIEHPRVFTLGRRGGRENLCVSEDFLAEKGVSVQPTDRGGDITYHGPGQLVVYPIINLNRRRLKVVDFVSGLEQAMIRTAGHWGIQAATDPKNRGVWLGGDKLGQHRHHRSPGGQLPRPGPERQHGHGALRLDQPLRPGPGSHDIL